jgi:hypothetical protein
MSLSRLLRGRLQFGLRTLFATTPTWGDLK